LTGLAGKTDLEKARAHMVVECIEDSVKPLIGVIRESDETKKVSLITDFMSFAMNAVL
jgi:hypothetical protein